MKTRVTAAYYTEVTSEAEMVEMVQQAAKLGIPYLLLGGGSNTVITSPHIEMLVVRNRFVHKRIIGTKPDTYSDLEVSSGYAVSRLARECAQEGLAGFEYHMGLPGTLGGAIYMNSKWTKPLAYIGDQLISARLLDGKGSIRSVDRDYFAFAYDYSSLQKTSEILLDAVFRMPFEDPEELKKRSEQALAYRRKTQPTHPATSGCFFQNITSDQMKRAGVDQASAGYLIDKAGMKGVRHGGFVVSQQHANFLLDEGEGDPQHLRELIEQVKQAVRDKYHIDLVEEVRLIS